MARAVGVEQQLPNRAEPVVVDRAVTDVQISERSVILDGLRNHGRSDLIVVQIERRDVTPDGGGNQCEYT